MPDIITAARALLDRVNFDVCGENGRGGNGGLVSKDTIKAADQLRLALNAAEKMALVPVEPTEAMLAAGHQQIDWCRDDQRTDVNDHPSQVEIIGGERAGTTCKEDLRDAWQAMLAAAGLSANPVYGADNG